jgi:hypothetical protein
MAQSFPDAVEEHIDDQDVLLPDSAGAGEAESAFSASQALEQLVTVLYLFENVAGVRSHERLSHCLQKT